MPGKYISKLSLYEESKFAKPLNFVLPSVSQSAICNNKIIRKMILTITHRFRTIRMTSVWCVSFFFHIIYDNGKLLSTMRRLKVSFVVHGVSPNMLNVCNRFATKTTNKTIVLIDDGHDNREIHVVGCNKEIKSQKLMHHWCAITRALNRICIFTCCLYFELKLFNKLILYR